MTKLLVIENNSLETNKEDQSVVEIHDRILDAYFGKMGAQFMRDTQKRVHWVCSMAKGGRVLDVGCSQGIVPVLLGREGYTVTGIDSDDQAIVAAETFLADQKHDVQTKVNFINADFISFPFEGALFDTVIISEVLEHLVDPASFVSLAAERLPPGGTLVVTVPFGVNDYIDHKWTFYALEPLRLVWELFSVDEVEVFGKWIGFSCSKRKSKARKGLTEWPWSLLEQMEEAFHSTERVLLTQTQSVNSKLDDANRKYRLSTEQVGLLKEILSRQKVSQNEAEGILKQTQVQLEFLQRQVSKERTEFKQEITSLTAEGQARSAAAHEAEKQLIRREADLEAVRGRLDDANQKYLSATEQVDSVNELLVQQEANQKVVEGNLKQNQAQLEELRARLAEERIDFQQEINRLTRDGQARSVAAHEAEKQLIRREADLEAVRGRLDDVNQKYLSATKQVDSVNELLVQQEADQKVVEGNLKQNQAQLEELRARLAKESIGFQQEINRLTEDGHGSEVELKLLRGQLDEANQKYCASSEQIVDLQMCLADERASWLTVEEELRKSLHAANLKYRQATGQQIPLLKQKLESQNQRNKEKNDQIRLEAEQLVIKTRDTLSFRLGYILLHCFKPFSNFIRLPKNLWLLRRESVRRKQKVKSKVFNLNKSVITQQSASNAKTGKIETGPMSSAARTGIVTSPTDIPTLVIDKGLSHLRVACIMDEFTFSSYAPECLLTQLTPTGWETELESSAPELLFIESAWRGKDELWGNKVGHSSQELQGIVEWCRQRNIPTIFWNKEDPVHFETFLNTARLFDYVFTTDIDCIHRYKAALKHERVFLLPFACQPKIHNPIEKFERKDAFCFAGAYYTRYPERTKDLESFVEELPSFKPLEIYDRNYGKDDPNYTFPKSYQPFIVGTLPFAEIDKAYKGYRYAINLNSIKQSQSMFARRVYELLASNTITVSNFSRGVRLLFGDLVVTTDSGSEQVRRLKEWTKDDVRARKLRLAALRKVMQDHTYGQRLAYVASKVSGQLVESPLPHIAVLARARSRNEQIKIIENFERQSYQHSTLYLIADKGSKTTGHSVDDRIVYLKQNQVKNKTIGNVVGMADFVAGMVAGDYYGPHYLVDIALATRYSDAQLLGKASCFSHDDGKIVLQQEGQSYRPINQIPARSAAIQTALVADNEMCKWVSNLPGAILEAEAGLALDEFNYCRKVVLKDEDDVASHVNDLTGLNTGISIDELLSRAEQIAPEELPEDESATLSGKVFSESFGKAPNKAVKLQVDGDSWQVNSTLEDGKHEYLYATQEHTPESLGFKDEMKFYLDVTPGLNIQLVIFFLDSQKQKISHVIKHPNRNQGADIPLGTAWIRLGLRFYAGGSSDIKGLVLGHRNLQPAEMIGQAKHLLLTNHYPSYEDLYRNGFVHSRVRAYREHGCNVDVFRLRTNEGVSYHEFEDIDVITGAQEVLHKMLSSGRYKSVLVHFLDSEMWDVLKHHIALIKVNVWVHGSEIQPWHRRDYNFSTDQERMVAKIQSDKRTKFWRDILQPIHSNMRLIFVSKYFSEEVMDDIGFKIPNESYSIIHNPIDTNIFNFEKKGIEQRKKILSIRSYASAKYANDLSVKTILAISKKPYFKDLEFRMIGDGALFDKTLEPLRKYKNIIIERGFLSQIEIATLHKTYGIFLVPTRMDAQGVSRDEAMSSGLIPVTNAVTAIPEFVDNDCGVLADGEDAMGMSVGIATLYENPNTFLSMSEAAAARIRKQSCSQKIVAQELLFFNKND